MLRLRMASIAGEVERAMGIEPTSSAWEAEVMAIIRRPQNWRFYRDWGGDGKGVVWGGGIETGMARCWSGGVAGVVQLHASVMSHWSVRVACFGQV